MSRTRSPGRRAVRLRRHRAAIAAWATCLGLACASARIERAQSHLEDRVVPKPPILLVYPFALTADDVALDTVGLGDGTPEVKSAEGARIQDALVFKTVAKLNERGINAKAGDETTAVPVNAFLVKGQFVTISEGDRTKRMLIGFGVGAERITTRIQVYRATPTGLERVADAEVAAQGDRMPGMAVPLGAGALAGRAAGAAVVSGGMNVMQEVTGGLDQAVENIADRIASRAETFYRARGWL